MSETSLKKFYEAVSVEPRDGRYTVCLDGRAAKTVGRLPLGHERYEVAAAVAAEWERQEDHIVLSSMPLTRLLGFAVDGAEKGQAEWTATVVQYAQSDLLCYRSDDSQLARRQAEQWDPILATVGQSLGAAFSTTDTIMAVEQDPVLIARLSTRLEGTTPSVALSLKLLSEILGSAVLTIALWDGVIEASAALEASRVDEDFQNERWGIDAEAAERAARIAEDFDIILGFLRLADTGADQPS